MPNNTPVGSPHHLRSQKSINKPITPTKPIAIKANKSKGPKDKSQSPDKVKQHHICMVCKDDTELRESLKQFDLSEFHSKTAKLQELDAELSDRIKAISKVDLRIQHLLLSEPAFKGEKREC